jgi:hypothetical protein
LNINKFRIKKKRILVKIWEMGKKKRGGLNNLSKGERKYRMEEFKRG